jgi:predicted nucleic acid-binding protein
VIFLDTSFLFALFAEDDANHARVVEVMDRYRGRELYDVALLTNHVIAETITLLRSGVHRDADVSHRVAVTVGRQLFAGVLGRLHQVSAEEERDAFEYLVKHRDKHYSFVDCVSFVVMEKRGIREALSVDSDFTHRFTALPGPLPK